MKNKKSVKAIISGRVQGVFYRVHTQKAAIEFGLTGYVKNLANGSVQALFQGSQDQIDQILTWCKTGSPSSDVSNIKVTEVPESPDFKTFDITY